MLTSLPAGVCIGQQDIWTLQCHGCVCGQEAGGAGSQEGLRPGHGRRRRQVSEAALEGCVPISPFSWRVHLFATSHKSKGIELVSTIFLIPAISFQISESAHFGRKERIVTKLEMPTCSSPPRGGRLSAQVGRALQPQDWPVTRGESHQSWSSTGGTPHLINHFSLGLGYASQTRKQGKTKGWLL